jgi:APA family basic amino acid/polyamine antiporter
MSLLVTDPGLTALFASGMATYAGSIVRLSTFEGKALAVAAILVLATINALGVTLGAGVIRALAALKLGLLGFLALWGFGRGLGDWSNFVPFVAPRPGAKPLPAALVSALIGAFFAFGGWWDTSKIAGEVRDPARTLPRALALGVGLVTAAYVLTSAVFWYLVPLASVTGDEGFAAQAGRVLFGRAGGVVFAAIVVVCVLGSLAGFLMAAPRVYYALARDGLFLPALATIHPRFGTPARAIAVQAALAATLVIAGTFEQILAYFFFTTVAFLALTVASVYVVVRYGPEPPLRLPGYPVTPLLFLVPIAGLLVLLAVDKPWNALLGTGVVASGLPVYEMVATRSRG